MATKTTASPSRNRRYTTYVSAPVAEWLDEFGRMSGLDHSAAVRHKLVRLMALEAREERVMREAMVLKTPAA